MNLGNFRQALIGIVCNLLILDSGFHEGWSTPTIPKFNKEDPLEATSDQIAWIVNLLYVGVGIGSMAPFFLMDRIGRKGTLLFTTIPKITSWILIGLGTHVSTIFIGRILAGIGCGITYAVMPMYIGEVTSKRTRGLLGTLIAVLLNIGMLMAYLIGLWLTRFTMAMIAIFIPVVFLLSFIWFPESSVFLTRKNKLTSAEKALQWSLGKQNVDEELEEIKRIVAGEDECNKVQISTSFIESITKQESKRAFQIAVILLSALTLTGVAPILAYQSFVFEEAGIKISTNLSIILTGCALVLAGTICVSLVPITGKRLLLLISTPACVFSLGAIGIFCTFLSSGYDVSEYTSLLIVFYVIFVFGYGLALNPVPLAYVGEIFPVEVKVPAAIFCSLFYALATSAVVKFYQVAKESYGTHIPFWTFTSITAFVWILIYLVVPETEGKSLEEIQVELRRKK